MRTQSITFPCLKALLLITLTTKTCYGFHSQHPRILQQMSVTCSETLHYVATSTPSTESTLEPSDERMDSVILEDARGHINPELAQLIFKWERDQRVNSEVRSGYSTREGLRWVKDLVRKTAGASARINLSSTMHTMSDDLIQEGVIALMQAMTSFEKESRPMQSFEVFAKERIQNALEDYLVTNQLASSSNSRKAALSVESTVEISDPLETHYSNQEEWEVREGLVLDNGQSVKPEELVGEFLDETLQYEGEDQMWVHQQQVAAPLRDSIPAKEEDDAMTGWLNDDGSSKDLTLDDMALRDMILYDVDSFLASTLDDLESQVIQLRFGLDTDTPKTQKEVAFELGLTVSRVRKLQRQALEKLRASYSTEYVAGANDSLNEDSV